MKQKYVCLPVPFSDSVQFARRRYVCVTVSREKYGSLRLWPYADKGHITSPHDSLFIM